MNEKKQTAEEKILRYLQEHKGKLLSINRIAAETDQAWSQVLRVINKLILNHIIAKHPKIVDELPVMPQKAADSFMYIPQLSAAEEVA